MAAGQADAAAKKTPAAPGESAVKTIPAAKGGITVKKNDGGSLELSNISDDDDAELLVENKDKPKSEAAEATVVDRAEVASRNDNLNEAAGRSEGRVQRERPRAEGEDFAGVRTGEPGGSSVAPSIGGATGKAPLASSPQSGDAGSAPIMPNPRPGTELAVPSTAENVSTGSLEKYRNLMVQEAATAAATGTQAVVENPAAVRRYIATDRAAYQKRMGY
jgi:hypothetical protein